MSNFMEVVRGRRSIRNFESRDIPDELLDQLLEAIRWAPSWANTQCWEVIVVKDPATRERLQQTMGKGNPATKSFAGAPVVMAMCAKLNTSGFYRGESTTKFGDWFMFDLGLATQNLCLAAHHFGLGTVITGLFDHDMTRDILKVPEGYEVVSLIPLGYPARAGGAPKRKEVSEFRHQDVF